MTGLDFYFQAYQELLTERNGGAIPWSSIIKWCEYNQFDDVNRLVKYVRALEITQRQVDGRRKDNSRGTGQGR